VGQRLRQHPRLQFGKITLKDERISAQLVELFGHPRHDGSHFFHQPGFVDPCGGSVRHDVATVDPDVPDGAAGLAVDDLPCDAVQRSESRIVQVERDDIGTHAGFDRADLFGDTGTRRAAKRYATTRLSSGAAVNCSVSVLPAMATVELLALIAVCTASKYPVPTNA